MCQGRGLGGMSQGIRPQRGAHLVPVLRETLSRDGKFRVSRADPQGERAEKGSCCRMALDVFKEPVRVKQRERGRRQERWPERWPSGLGAKRPGQGLGS